MAKTRAMTGGNASPHPKFLGCPSGDEHAPLADMIEKVLSIIGGKWKVLIVYHLGTRGVCRFGELRRLIPGITQKMLTAALREMEHDGLLLRTVYAEVPPRVEYRLTEEGADLRDVYAAISSWGSAHAELVGRHVSRRSTADVRAHVGHELAENELAELS